MNFFNRHRWIGLRLMGQCSLVALITPSLLLPATAATTRPVAMPSVNSAVANGDNDEYILGPGDRLRVDFFSVPEFSSEYQVLPNGTLNLPRVGGVNVQGMTIRQASATISTTFSRYLTRPLITVSLVEGRAVNVAIAGEINRPGAYGMNSALANRAGGGTLEVPTLTNLIKMAEGITQSADLVNIQIQRRQADGLHTYRVNLWKLMRSGDASQDIRLQAGDSIYIPVTTNLDKAEARERTRTNIATSSNRPLRIAIVGEVNRPGPYTIFEGAQQADNRNATPNSIAPSITKALQVSGGITQMADLRNIRVRRLTHTGEQLIPVNFWELLQSGDILQDLPLQDGDRIEVARATTANNSEQSITLGSSIAPDRIAINIVGEVQRPGGVEVPPNTPMNQGILAAGGFNNRAKKSVVTLVRLEPNGTVSKRDINVDFGKGIDEAGNPPLRKGDTIIVKRSGLSTIGDGLGILSAPVSGAFGLLRLLGIIR
jgi:polysaccharide biosynthesis/export protein